MRFFDYAWFNSFQITKKKESSVKILFREGIPPSLIVDEKGYVLYLPKPRRTRGGRGEYQGIPFDLEDPAHRRMVWGLFRASLYHLSLHVAASDYSLYSDWMEGRDPRLSRFVISLLEDASLNAYLRVFWSTLIPAIAYANALSYLLLKPAELIPRRQLRLMAAILSASTMGLIKGRLEKPLREEALRVVSYLRAAEEVLQEYYLLRREEIIRGGDDATRMEGRVAEKKLGYADQIYGTLARHGPPPEAPALPYAEHHGESTVFSRRLPGEKRLMELTKRAAAILSPESEVPLEDSWTLWGREAEQNISDWLSYEARKEKILSQYVAEGRDTRFHSFGFPDEDYAEFLRRRERLSGPIRRALTRLILYQNVLGEDPRKEAGVLDLQEAIQAMASKSIRSDVFITDELQNRRMTWGILVDVSRSLRAFTGEEKDVVLCLAEVVKGMIFDPNTWGMFAFDNNFYVVKDFSENYTNDVKARIGGLRNSGLTYLPDAVKLVTRVLTRRYEEAKILAIVSDGFPTGYKGAEEEFLKQVRETWRRGIGVIGIGIKSRAVKRYIKTSCVVETPYDLMKKFVDAFFEYTALL
ncbi:hypothetical protein CW700_00560 [Candidatus Bathyarchaeota archaeon]|nr:MAG: hypothetical protein CW700_00560 [Candidatus Bathyarchaeota archaeon]